MSGGSSSTSSSQSTTSTNLNLQDSGGITVANSKGTSINVTDGGAIQANTDISLAAIKLGGSAVDAGVAVANHGLDNAAQAYALGLDKVTGTAASALAGYQAIATQNSASTSTQIQKIALYAIAAAVALVVLPKLLK